MNAKTRDRLGSILMLVFIAVLWVQRDYMTPFGGIFPDIVLVSLAVLVALTLLLSFTPFKAIKDDSDKQKEATKSNWGEMVVVAIVLLVWTGLLRYLGFALTGVLGFGGISWFLSERRASPRVMATCFIIGLAMTYLLVFVFEQLLKVPLPKGTLFN